MSRASSVAQQMRSMRERLWTATTQQLTRLRNDVDGEPARWQAGYHLYCSKHNPVRGAVGAARSSREPL